MDNIAPVASGLKEVRRHLRLGLGWEALAVEQLALERRNGLIWRVYFSPRAELKGGAYDFFPQC